MRMAVNTADLQTLCLEIRRYRDESALANARLIEELIHNRGLIEATYADLCTFRLEMRSRFDIQDRFIMDMYNELIYRFHNHR
nr:TPA_asm: hypothetical protein [Pimephales minnow adintovirus]